MAFTANNKKQPTKLHAIMSNFLLYIELLLNNEQLGAKILLESTILYCLALELFYYR